jgi:guanylate kinase
MKPARGLLFVVSAPSGAGKTSLVSALVRADTNLRVSVSHTTRTRRPSEVEGEHYHFVDAAHFREMMERDEFLEHALVFGNHYGTARSAVEHSLVLGRDVILEIDWQGARQVRERRPDAVSIFVLPPSRALLAERLKGRAQDGADAILERTRKAVSEMTHYDEYDYVIVNADFDVALADLAAIVRAERLGQAAQRERLAPLIGHLLSGAEPIE